MKMTTNDYTQLKSMIEDKIFSLQGDLSDYLGSYQKNGGNWQMRFRWDLLWSIPYAQREPWFRSVYKYCNDDHIDTALRKIMKGYM